jgi:serine/threonine protein kinase
MLAFSGYIALEVFLEGSVISIKSDVFSFGVVLLEIISEKKNTIFLKSKVHKTIQGYVSVFNFS